MRRPTVVLRTAALATSAALVALSAAPGAAAQPLAKGTAVGLTLTVGGSPTDSGAYTVSNDGSGETSTGARDPQIRLAGGQNAAQLGTVAQNARTRVQTAAALSSPAPASPATAPRWPRWARATACRPGTICGSTKPPLTSARS